MKQVQEILYNESLANFITYIFCNIKTFVLAILHWKQGKLGEQMFFCKKRKKYIIIRLNSQIFRHHTIPLLLIPSVVGELFLLQIWRTPRKPLTTYPPSCPSHWAVPSGNKTWVYLHYVSQYYYKACQSCLSFLSGYSLYWRQIKCHKFDLTGCFECLYQCFLSRVLCHEYP